jgi:tetratricopeptide (TPR) repeat protein/predicted Ser/Thr protein kinase
MASALFSHYEIIEALGGGGVGVVYKARDLHDGKLVAVKVIPPELTSDPAIVEHFINESAICSELDHPHITAVYESGYWGGQAYLAMEYLEGGSLQDLFDSHHRLELIGALEVAIQIADALVYAHSQQVLHRDVKPSNILLQSRSFAKLADFGIARTLVAQGVPHEDEVMGTPYYMSPEQVMGRQVDYRTDLFSLGCVLYEMIAGRRAFSGKSDMAVVYAVCSEEPVDLLELSEGVPVELDFVVRKALAKDPESRYRSAYEMQSDLEIIRDSLVQGAREVTQVLKAMQEPVLRWSWRCSTLVYRDQEMDQLRGHLVQAIEGKGSVVLIAGEAGVGKSRLVEELAEWGRRRGVRHFVGHAAYGGGGIPYQPFLEALRRFWMVKGVSDAESLDSFLAQKASHLAGRAYVYQAFFGFGPSQSTLINREQLWDSLVALLKVVALDRPLLLQIENVHWIDEETAEFLRYLAYMSEDLSVLLVMCYRPEEVEDERESPFCRVQRDLKKLDYCYEISLGRLNEDGTQHMVSAIFPGSDLGEGFCKRVYEETEGNPFFIVELMDLLREERRVVPRYGAWTLVGEPDALPIPRRIGDLVMERLSRIGELERRLLEVASVEGDIFHRDILAGCLNERPMTVLLSLQNLDERHRLVHAAEGGYRFDHVKVREIIYDSIEGKGRRRYHYLIGKQLEREYGMWDDRAGVIAHHYLEADEREEAVDYLVRAGDHARRVFANTDAITYYGHALELMEPHDPQILTLLQMRSEVLELVGRWDEAEKDGRMLVKIARDRGDRSKESLGLIHLGGILVLLGGYDEALNLYNQSLEITKEIRDRHAEALCWGRIGNIYWYRGDYAEATRLYRESLQIKKDIGDRQGEASTLTNIGLIHYHRGEYTEAMNSYRASLEIQKEIGDRRGEAHTLCNMGIIEDERGNYFEALRSYQESLSIAREIGDRLGESANLGNIGLIHQQRGNYEEALSSYEGALKIEKEIRNRRGEAQSLNYIGSVLYQKGDYALALTSHQDALDIAADIGDESGEVLSLTNIGMNQWISGHFGDALEKTDRALEMAQEHGLKPVECEVLRYKGLISMSLGQVEEAWESVERSVQRSTEIDALDDIVLSRIVVGRFSIAQGDLVTAKKELDESLKLAQAIGNIDATQEALLGCGALRVVEGNHEEAARYAQEALEEARRVGRPYDEARALLLWSRIHQAMGDNDKVLECAIGCVETAGSRGMAEVLFQALHVEAQVLLERGEKREALTMYRRALDVIEGICSAIPDGLRESFLSQPGVVAIISESRELTEAPP